jgi:hypothetical protein
MAQDKSVQPQQNQSNNPAANGIASKLNQKVAGKGSQPAQQTSVNTNEADRELLNIIRNVYECV